MHPLNGHLTFHPLSAALGVEIRGIDIANGITDSDFKEIEAAWHRHGLICLPGQEITEDQQVAFGACFGTLAPWSRFADKVTPNEERNPYLMLVTNLKENGEYIGSLAEGDIEFHSDGIYVEEPLAATMLYCLTPTAHGGETAFVNMYNAYETLPGHMKERIEGLKALHAFTYDSTRAEQNEERKTNWDEVAHCVHPVVRTHPVTQRKALYVNRLMTQEITGMDGDESREILDFLYAHLENPAFMYEHKWRKGDVLLWDNRCLAHARRDFPPDETRLMKRLTIKGNRPF
ncbi:MAG: taurine dioxygenase [Alphaproteobacteria bacterium]|jgi:taurine dioxygenase